MASWESPGVTDAWYTPPEVFEALGCRFDLDVAHPGIDAPCCPGGTLAHRQRP